MVVHKDGSIFGTIGGGEVEGDVIRLSLNVFETADGSYLWRQHGSAAGVRFCQ